MHTALRCRLALLTGLVGMSWFSPVFAQPAKEAPVNLPPPTPTTAQTGLIARELLFGNPDKSGTQISPDGTRISYLAPVDGVMNVWVAPLAQPDAAKPVTQDKKRGIRGYFWAFNNTHLVYSQDSEGDENWHVYAVNLAANETKDLTPLKKVAAHLHAVSHKFPDEALVGLNDRDEQFHDVYRINLKTGERKRVQENKEFAGYVFDDDFNIRFGQKYLPDGAVALFKPEAKGYSEFLKIPAADTLTTNPAGFDATGQVLYLIDSRGRDTGAFTTLDLKTGKPTIVAQDAKADAADVLAHPTTNVIQAVGFAYDRKKYHFLDAAVEADFAALAKVSAGDININSRTLDDSKWIVAFLQDNGPVKYYVYERASKQAKFLFTNRKALNGLPLQPMHPRIVKARDGLDLVCYLTLPPGTDPANTGKPNQPVPLVLNVHGGPWARDDWGFDPEHQFFANRGYAVLSVNFRGSTGFGKNFVNAGNKEWAGKMHHDLLDAVDWAVKAGICPADKVAIYGGSYGGYATLVGLTFTPDKFACGVDIVGPSNILTLLNTIPPYWAPMIQLFKDRVGDHTTTEGKQFLNERSPLSKVDAIKKPLLIGQGANDPRVKQSESDQIVQAMTAKKIPVTYALFPDEGHGFARPENRLAFYAITEAFFARHLGGRYEAVGTAFKGSSVTIPTGAADVPGLPAVAK
jgi:dipeptidyl aminopeptidase/acylaminoacyl peptidase